MREIKMRLLVLSALATLLIAFPGCEGDPGPAGPQGAPGESRINVRALMMPGMGEDEVYVVMSLSNSPSIPQATINDYDLILSDRWFRVGARLAYNGIFPIEIGAEADLEISFTKTDGSAGLARSTITMPGDCNIIMPDNDPVMIILGDNLEVTWNSVIGADFYLVMVYFRLLYTDTGGVDQDFIFAMDTTVTDTSIFLAGSRLFPDLETIGSIYGFGADFDVAGISGAWSGAQTNNITGDGMGFFIGAGYAADLDFILGIPGSPIESSAGEKNQVDEYLTRMVLD